jgi:phosphate starvation-inducible PhoH-like protein
MTKKKIRTQTISTNNDKFSVISEKLTINQKKLLAICSNKNTKIVFISGPAGSSKTYISVYSALKSLSLNSDLDLSYIRTIIESADKGLGALPGDLNDKFNPYMIPLEEKLYEILPKNTTARKDLFESGRIDAIPINFLRGSSWKDKIVIMDEAQNATFQELTTLITRIGENSKLFICGDPMQSDINGKSGFNKMMNLFSDKESEDKGIHTFRFSWEDIMRSEILKFIIKKLEKK